MNYPNIKVARLSHEEIARYFGFKTRNAFRSSSAFHRYMEGIEKVLEHVKRQKG